MSVNLKSGSSGGEVSGGTANTERLPDGRLKVQFPNGDVRIYRAQPMDALKLHPAEEEARRMGTPVYQLLKDKGQLRHARAEKA